jgi:type IV pilus assembly protein PilV
MENQKGTSLIEVLVTVVIVSFGLLGVAGVMSNALKANHGSYGRTQASILSADIVDRMRANRMQAQSSTLPYQLEMSANPTTDGTFAKEDLIAWRNALAAALPAGTGSVNVDAATNKVRVVIRWDESRMLGGSAYQTFVVETRL